MRGGLLVVLSTLFGALLALAVGQWILARSSQQQLHSYAVGLLRHSVAVGASGNTMFRTVGQSAHVPCSRLDLDEMRYLIFAQPSLYDIGRVRDGYLLCTANWGVFDMPLKLPPPHRQQANGNRLWHDAPNVADRRMVVDMAAHDGVIVFTAPTAFADYERMSGIFSALVLTRDGRHVFHRFGDVHGLANRLRARHRFVSLGSRLTDTVCSSTLDVCVVAAMADVNLLHRSPLVAVQLIGFGGAGFGILALLLLRRRRLRMSLPQRVRRAVLRGRVRVVYQPLVRLRDNYMLGVEALVRLNIGRGKGRGREVSPDIFIPIAEQHGFITLVTKQVIHGALAEMRDRLTSDAPFYISINLSAEDLTDPEVRAFLDRETVRHDIDRARVSLELTERSTVEETELVRCVRHFRDGGYSMCLDDFGTGYSGFAYLSKLPIFCIKIDKMFTDTIGLDGADTTLFDNMMDIARKLGFKVVVEGVTKAEQVPYILAANPEAIGQGYLFGKPMTARELADWEAGRAPL